VTQLRSLPSPGQQNFSRELRLTLNEWKAVIESLTGNGGSGVDGIVAGGNISVDNTNPQYPVVAVDGGTLPPTPVAGDERMLLRVKSDLSGYEPAMYPPTCNILPNGFLSVWQRGTSFSASDGKQLADYVKYKTDQAGDTTTITREPFAAGQADVPGGPMYYLKVDRTVAATSGTWADIAIMADDVETLSGRTATLSFWAKAGGESTIPGIWLTQNYGTGGSPSATVDYPVQYNVAVGTAWQQYTYTIDVPAAAGTKGTDPDSSHIMIRIRVPADATFTFSLANVRLHAADTVPGQQDIRSFADFDLMRCQRRYCKSYNLDVPPGTVTSSGQCQTIAFSANYATGSRFISRMLGSPAVVLFSPSAGTAGAVDTQAGTTTSGAATNMGQTGFSSVYDSSGGLTAGQNIKFHYVAKSDL